jgi:ribose transport system ATP-binding protein
VPVEPAAAGRGEDRVARLEVRSLCAGARPGSGFRPGSKGVLRDISLRVAPGEILGLGGLVGAGRSELLDALFGLAKGTTGEILVDGEAARITTPRHAIRAGFGYVPEDRRLQGLFFALGVHENIALPAMPRLARRGWRHLEAERELVGGRVSRFQIKCASTASPPGQLSGGNQQKLLIARWMGRATRVLLLDEPTRGIDVGTKAEIHRLIREAGAQGTAVLLVSSEMPELLALSDRIAVLCEGRLAGELRGREMTQSAVLRLATSYE